jgi:copper resistance protein C
MRFLSSSLIAAVLFLISPAAAPTPAHAHAIVVAAEPAVGAMLSGSTVQVMLRFNSRIDSQRSRLTLMRPDGSSVRVPLIDTDSSDTLAAKIDGLSPGQYRLRWQVLGIDGHITRGDIPFAVVA